MGVRKRQVLLFHDLIGINGIAMKSGENVDVNLDFLDPEVQENPYGAYSHLQSHCPVYKMENTGYYMITRYEDVRQALERPEIFRNEMPPQKGLSGDQFESYQKLLEKEGWRNVPTLNRCDGDRHRKYRGLVDRVFTAKRVKAMYPELLALCDEIMDEFCERGECEFVNDFALQLSGRTIIKEMGLSIDTETLRAWGDAFVALRSRLHTEEEMKEVARTELEAQKSFAALFEERRSNPSEDIISGLLHARLDNEEPLTDGELQGVCAQLVTAGFESTMSAISHAMLFLIDHPELSPAFKEDESKIPDFVEEVLRLESPVQELMRYVAEDTEISGVPLEKGSVVMLRFGAANRDAEKFSCPHGISMTDPSLRSHLAFGAGVHRCIGAPLARAELTAAVTTIVGRMENIKLLSRPETLHTPSFFLRGIDRLDISFDCTARSSG
jgi:cytochrome P450